MKNNINISPLDEFLRRKLEDEQARRFIIQNANRQAQRNQAAHATSPKPDLWALPFALGGHLFQDKGQMTRWQSPFLPPMASNAQPVQVPYAQQEPTYKAPTLKPVVVKAKRTPDPVWTQDISVKLQSEPELLEKAKVGAGVIKSGMYPQTAKKWEKWFREQGLNPYWDYYNITAEDRQAKDKYQKSREEKKANEQKFLQDVKDRPDYEGVRKGMIAAAAFPMLPIALEAGAAEGAGQLLRFIGNPASSVANWLNLGSKATKIAGGIDNLYNLYQTADGLYNLFTGNGVQKTYRLAKDGDWWGAAKSGMGDALNAFPVLSSWYFSRPVKTLVNDIRYAKNYFKNHWADGMNTAETVYNITRPLTRFIHRASTANEYLNPIVSETMLLNEGLPQPQLIDIKNNINYLLNSRKDILSKVNWNAHKNSVAAMNLPDLYGNYLLRNTRIGQALDGTSYVMRHQIPEYGMWLRAKSAPPMITGSEYAGVPIYPLHGDVVSDPKRLTGFEVPNNWKAYRENDSGVLYDFAWGNNADDIGGHYERSKDGINEVFDIQHYTPWSEKHGYNKKWVPYKKTIMNHLLGVLDVFGDNYALYKYMPIKK